MTFFDFAKFRQCWSYYCESSTFSGLYIIGGRINVTKINRSIVFAFWLIVLGYCLSLWIASVQQYFDFKLKTRIIYNSKNELEFPAITICNQNLVRRSAAQKYDLVSEYPVFAYTDDFKDTAEREELMIKTCGLKGVSTISMGVSSFKEIFQRISMDSKALLKCSWKNDDKNCSKIFYNHLTDYRICFSFNQDPASSFGAQANDLQSEVMAYGMSVNNFKSETVNTARNEQSGLQILLDAKQNESCGTMANSYNGAGFQVRIHDPRTQTLVDIRVGLMLAPGFEYNIEIRPVSYNLKTEWLNRCRSKTDFWFEYLNNTIYSQHQCLFICMARALLKKCNCRLFSMSEKLVKEWTGLTEKLPDCMATDFWKNALCLKNVTKAVERDSLASCPECKRPCYETRYEHKVFAKKLTIDVLKRVLNLTVSEMEFRSMKKDYLIAKFYYPEMLEVTIIEDIEISPLDVFLNLAGTLGLLTGASVITVYEIIHEIVYSIIYSCMVSFSKKIYKTKVYFVKSVKI